MPRTDLPLPLPLQPSRQFGETSRTDPWWIHPALVFLGLTVFVVYTTWAAFQGQDYYYGGNGAHYLSPFYSPLLFGAAGEPRVFGSERPGWWPTWAPFSAAFLILLGPGGFRFTCYYYRGAYYKAFWADPPACAVGEPAFRGSRYRGERWLPLILQNAHRYFFYIAVIFVLVLTWDAWHAFWFTGEDGVTRFGVGIGSLVLLGNAFFLGGYTFGCHCARHLFGGRRDRLADAPVQRSCYACVSALNRRHMLWAWVSLVWVAFADLYVRMLATGTWTDFRIF